jgi:hypothetical protein
MEEEINAYTILTTKSVRKRTLFGNLVVDGALY